MRIDAEAREFWIGQTRIAAGDTLTLDGDPGRVYAGAMPVETEEGAVSPGEAGRQPSQCAHT